MGRGGGDDHAIDYGGRAGEEDREVRQLFLTSFDSLWFPLVTWRLFFFCGRFCFLFKEELSLSTQPFTIAKVTPH